MRAAPSLALLASALAVAAGCAPEQRTSRPPAADGPPVGEPLPAFSARDLGGQRVDLSRLGGRALLINLWATWCLPCVEEMPELQELQSRYDPDELTVLGVSVDRADPARVLAFLERHGIDYQNVMADFEELVTAMDLNRGVPHTLLVDGEGVVKGYWRGRFRPFEPPTEALIRSVVASRSATP